MPRTNQGPTNPQDELSQPHIPPFMRADARKGTEGWTPEDMAWIGEKLLTGDAARERDEELNVLSKNIFTPRNALRRILLEIIQHNRLPNRKLKDGVRLEQALAALVGPEPATTPQADLDTQTKRHPGGPKTKPDDALLLAIAREYFADTHGLFGKKRSITKIINEVIETDVPNSKELNLKQKKSIRRRLAKKFKEAPDRDRVMLKYSGGAHYEAKQYVDFNKNVLRNLAGVELVDPKFW